MNNDDNKDFALHLLKTVNKENFWYSVEEVMKWLYKNYPEDMAFLEEMAKNKRAAHYDKFGRAKNDQGKTDNNMRDLGIIPSIFSDMITKFYGGAIDDKGDKIKFYRTFFKKYPTLRTAQKI